MSQTLTNFSEKELEDYIVNALVLNGYQQGNPSDFDKTYAIDTTFFWQFLHASQQQALDNIAKFNTDWQKTIIHRLNNTIKKYGILQVLKKGLDVDNAHLDFLYPLPLASSSQIAHDKYQQNIFSVTRQVRYSHKNGNSVDLVLFVNGLAVITLELKSTHKNQTARFNAIEQYKLDRSPEDTLFNFTRCIVHFTLDNQEAFMTTRLNGCNTFFLPFNKGNKGSAGNPANPNGFNTEYLWNEVLQPDSLVNLISHFVRLGTDNLDIKKPTLNDMNLYFPRYHQMSVVRRLMSDVEQAGVGKRYLIQHSAGSGKSNSITWLAYQLIEAYPNQTEQNADRIEKPIYDSVIVVTDRKILDKQLKENIKQFSEVKGIIAHAERSKDLRTALENGKKVIITTIQKFPYILDDIGEMADKKFAIIIDEAHSSQSGQAHDGMNTALGIDSDNDKDSDSDDNQDRIVQAMENRKMRGNASYFAFTATPKDSTLEKFGEKQIDGSFKPFDLYSMKQAIEEGFILDVVRNYTTFKSYYEIQKSVEDDPLFDSTKAQKALKSYVERQQQTIDVKAEIMLDHFISNIYAKKRLKGHAKAMVVTQNIEAAIRYYQAINRLLEQKGNPFKAIIAFSGEKTVNGISYTESQMNGFEESKTKDKFDTDEYRILVVANKYLTGFDQPKLCAMYIDKKLRDVQAVQTLSRLNRSANKYDKKTEDLFVLDFFNTLKDIKAAFDKYFTVTTLSEATDINVLNDIKTNLDDVGVYEQHEVIEYADLYFGWAGMEVLQGRINIFAERFNHELELSDNEKIEFKMQAKQFVKLYSRLASILPFNKIEWERLFWLLKALIPELNVRTTEDDAIDELLESVDLNTYAIERTALASTINLDSDEAVIDPTNPNPITTHPEPDQQDELDEIVKNFNERWFKNWHATPEEQRVKFVNLTKRIHEHPDFKHKYLATQDEQHRAIEFHKIVKEIIVADRRKEIDFYKQFVQDEAFQLAFLHSLRNIVDKPIPSAEIK